MEAKLKAFHGDKKLKTAMLRQLNWHAKQDMIVKGTYGDDCENGDFRGCAIGCSIHSLARIQKRKLDTSNHRLLETKLGIPAEIAYLIDGLFEALPEKDAMSLPKRVIAAITPGADLSMVIPQFLLWMLSDEKIGLITEVKYQETRTFVEAVIALFAEWVKTGVRPTEGSTLGRDARDAWDAWAARDARDAWDARDARDAWDAWDARDAWDAWAARDARDARDAWDARNKAATDKLIELLESAS